jgi:hypothetical protein
MSGSLLRPVIAGIGLLLAGQVLAGGAAEVIGLRGEAWASQGGSQTRLVQGSAIGEGTTVVTKEGGRVKLRFADGSVVVVGETSTFTIEKFGQGGDGKRAQADMKLDMGLMSQTVAPGKPDSWRVSTPTVVTAVRGTEYLIEVRPDRTTEVSVLSGQVALNRVRTPGKFRSRAVAADDLGSVQEETVLLQSNAGTTCTAGGCREAGAVQGERFRSLKDRLSGV